MYERGPLSRELADIIARSIAQCITQADAFTLATETYQPAGMFASDLQAINELDGEHKRVRDGLHATIISTVGMILAHALDHIRSLHGDLQRDPVPIWSPLTLSRAVLESTVLMCHLLEPTIGTEERLCREAALWLDDTQYAATAAATFGDDHTQSVRDYHRFKLGELEAGGFTVEVDGNQRPLRVRLGEQRAELRLNITDQAARILPQGRHHRTGSALAPRTVGHGFSNAAPPLDPKEALSGRARQR